MKRLLAVLMLVLFLTGCKGTSDSMDQALILRKNILAGNGCSFHTVITADYDAVIYTFSVDCICDKDGELTFTVTEPESIAGITGTLSPEGGKLTFDDKALAFPVLANGELSPVSAPYVFVKALRGGYISGCGEEGGYTRVSVDDSYDENALQLELWLDGQLPIQAEIYWQGRRVLSLQITNFKIL